MLFDCILEVQLAEKNFLESMYVIYMAKNVDILRAS